MYLFTFVFRLSSPQKTNYNQLAPIGTQRGFLHLLTFHKKHLYIFLHFTFKKSIVTFSYISLSGKACAGDILDPLDTKLRKTGFSLSKRTLSSCFCSNPRNTNVIPKCYHQIRFSNFSQLSAAQNVK